MQMTTNHTMLRQLHGSHILAAEQTRPKEGEIHANDYEPYNAKAVARTHTESWPSPETASTKNSYAGGSEPEGRTVQEAEEEAWNNQETGDSAMRDVESVPAQEENEEEREEALQQIVRDIIAKTPPRERGERAEW